MTAGQRLCLLSVLSLLLTHAIAIEYYVGGEFVSSGFPTSTSILRVGFANSTSDTLTAVPSALGFKTVKSQLNEVRGLQVPGEFADTFAVGAFSTTESGLRSTLNVAQLWRTFSSPFWTTLKTGLAGRVEAVQADSSFVYVTGRFLSPWTRIAAYDRKLEIWIPLGDETANAGGINNEGRALKLSGTKLYVGGFFTKAGPIAANRIAVWNINTQTWSTLGNGANNAVYALEVISGFLYVGGAFTKINGVDANNIAKYEISTGTFTTITSGTNGEVRALAATTSDIFVGGFFTSAGGLGSTKYVARITAAGTSPAWGTVGDANRPVLSLSASGDEVAAGGMFTSIGGTAANYTAAYVSGSWRSVGAGVNDIVRAVGAIPAPTPVPTPTAGPTPTPKPVLSLTEDELIVAALFGGIGAMVLVAGFTWFAFCRGARPINRHKRGNL